MSEIIDPKQLAAEAQSDYRQGDYTAAAQAYLACASAFAARQESAQAAEMRADASVAFLMAGDLQAALEAQEGLVDFFTQSGDIRRLGLVMGNRAAILEELRQLDAASEAYERSAELLKQAGDFESRSFVMQSLSKLQLRRGQQFLALATMQAGIESIPNPTPRQKLLKRLLKIPAGFLNLRS